MEKSFSSVSATASWHQPQRQHDQVEEEQPSGDEEQQTQDQGAAQMT